jgi:hypothetical protein
MVTSLNKMVSFVRVVIQVLFKADSVLFLCKVFLHNRLTTFSRMIWLWQLLVHETLLGGHIHIALLILSVHRSKYCHIK